VFLCVGYVAGHRMAYIRLQRDQAMSSWVNNAPWVASELSPLIPQQRTCSDRFGMSVLWPRTDIGAAAAGIHHVLLKPHLEESLVINA
jgi:hypothetical protein